MQREETPQPFVFDNYLGDLEESDITGLQNYLSSVYGYDAGGFLNNTRLLTSDKVLAKIDWNLSDKHKLSIRHSYVKGVSTSPAASTPTTINFENGGIYFPAPPTVLLWN